jgi:amino acid permease
MPDLTPVSGSLRSYGYLTENVCSSDRLVPDFDSSKRQSPMVVAIFNLSATIVGGGVLSLPLAFSKCGIVLGSILMIVAAVVTERSLYLLCLCARLTGATSYGEVGKVAFGKYMEYFISLLIFVFLMFVLVGYMVLLQDIWSDLIQIMLRLEAPPHAPTVLFWILLVMGPFLAQRSLYTLRYNCYVGFASVSILCLALCHHAIVTPFPSSIRLWGDDLKDVLFAFPIIILSFLSIFNVLPIQGNLIRPSRARMLGVIDGAVVACFILMLIFGLAGYLYAGDNTDGNILNNANVHSDWIFFLGRLGCGVTIMLAMAMMLLPARAGLLEVIDVFVNGPHVMPVEVSEATPLVQTTSQNHSNHVPAMVGRPTLMDNDNIHYTATLAIAVICFIASIRVPGVAFVWSLCGSSMAFLIAFILPAACYLQIQRVHPEMEEKSPGWTYFSWFLLLSSVVSSIACTIQTITRYS